jgi:uncharacterized protein YegP (UPF0339 family)
LEDRVVTKIVRNLFLGLTLVTAAGLVAPDLASGQAKDKKDKDKKAPGVAVFEVYKDKGGKYRFRFMDGDGKELAMSHVGYEKKADIEKVITTIKSNAAKAKVVEEKK